MEKYKEKVSSVYKIKDQRGEEIIIPSDDLIEEAAVYLERGGVSLSGRKETARLQAELALRRTLEKYNPLVKPEEIDGMVSQIKQDVPRVLELFEEKKETTDWVCKS